MEAAVTIPEALHLRIPISPISRPLEKRTMSRQKPKFLGRGFGQGLRLEGLLGMDLGGALQQQRSSNHRRKGGLGHKLNQAGGRVISARVIAAIVMPTGIVGLARTRARDLVGLLAGRNKHEKPRI